MTDQIHEWQENFGSDYIKRNPWDARKIGLRAEQYQIILSELGSKTVFEVGCNIGMNLAAFESLDYYWAAGCDINTEALRQASENGFQVNLGSSFDTKMRDSAWDLVLSCGLLIHHKAEDLDLAIKEMLRISKRYFLLIEYWAEKETEVIYRGKQGLLWKRPWNEILLKYPVKFRKWGFLGKDQGFDNCHYWLVEKNNASTI